MIFYGVPHSSYATKAAIVIAVKGIEGEVEWREPPGGLRHSASPRPWRT